jgi:hypothetical protein
MPATLDIKRVLAMLDGSEPLPAVQLERVPVPATTALAAPGVPTKPSAAPADPVPDEPSKSPAPAPRVSSEPATPPPDAEETPAVEDRSRVRPAASVASPSSAEAEDTVDTASDDEPEKTAPTRPPQPTLPFDSPSPTSAQPTGRESRSAFGQPALFVEPKPRKDDSKASADDSDIAVAELVEADAPEFWQAFVSRVMDEMIHVGALLRHARASSRPDGVLEIRVPDTLSIRMLREHESLLLEVARELGGDHWSAVTLAVDPGGAQPDPNEPREHDPEASLLALCEEYPALRVLMERFGGEIVW